MLGPMPKSYHMGGRATPGGAPPPPHGAPAPAPRSWRERFGALRNLPPFLKEVWATSPALASSDMALRLVRALLPVVTLFVGKLIVDEVVALVQRDAVAGGMLVAWESGVLNRLAA